MNHNYNVMNPILMVGPVNNITETVHIVNMLLKTGIEKLFFSDEMMMMR